MKSASAPKRARNDVVSGNVDRLADHGQFVRPDHRPRNSDRNDEDAFWDDEVNDDLLLHASQVAEAAAAARQNKVETLLKNPAGGARAMDEEELAEMSRLLVEADDAWNLDEECSKMDIDEGHNKGLRQQDRFKQTQVVLGVPPDNKNLAQAPEPSGENRPAKKAAFGNAISSPRFNRSRPSFSLSEQRPSSPLLDPQRLQQELNNAKKEVKRLNDEKCRKHGEVLFLRGELSKRESMLKAERLDRQRAQELAMEQIRQIEDTKRRELEAAKTDEQFLRQEMRQLEDKVKRQDQLGSSQQSSMAPPQSVRPLSSQQQVRPLLPNSNNSFLMQDEPFKVSKLHRKLPDATTQTEETKNRRCALGLRIKSDNFVSPIYALSVASIAVGPKALSLLGQGDFKSFSVSHLLGEDSDSMKKMWKVSEELIALAGNQEASEDEVSACLLTATPFIEGLRLPSNRDEVEEGLGTALFRVGESLLMRDPPPTTCVIVSYLQALRALAEFSPESLVKGASSSLPRESRFCHVLKSVVVKLGDSPLILGEVLRLLATAAVSCSSLGRSYCRKSKESCFIPLICGASLKVLQNRATEADVVFALAQRLASLLSSLMVDGGHDVGKWLASGLEKGDNDIPARNKGWTPLDCEICRTEVLKAAVSVTAEVVTRCDQVTGQGLSTPPVAYPSARRCLTALHHLLVTSGDQGLAGSLTNNPSTQRILLWLTRQLDRIRPALNLKEGEGVLIDGLSIEWEDSQMVERQGHT